MLMTCMLNDMLISLHFVQYVEIRFKMFSLLALMYRKNFVRVCSRAFSHMHTIFATVHYVSDMNKIYKLHEDCRLFTRIHFKSAQSVHKWMDRQATECINTFQFFWKGLIMFKKSIFQLKTLFQSFLDVEQNVFTIFC